jgi:hypothetical protein
MKKILLSTLAALSGVLIVSYKDSVSRVTTYYYDVTAVPPVPYSVTTLMDYQVKRRANPAVNPGDICSGNTYLCIVSFFTSQLTAGKVHLNTGGIPISYQQVISTKN